MTAADSYYASDTALSAGLEPGGEAAEMERRLLEQLPQVKVIARRIHDRLPPHVPLDDLVQAGIVGLMDAVYKYDPGKKVPLPAYAKFRIRGAILDSLRDLDWSPRQLRRKSRRIEDAHRKLHAELGRPATDEELAAALELPLEELQQVMGQLRGLQITSFDEPSGADDEATEPGPGANQPAPFADPYSACLRTEMQTLLAAGIAELPEREQQVLSLYYYDELTMKEVGAVLGVGESRVCQIHSAALVRLRSRLRRPQPAAAAAPGGMR